MRYYLAYSISMFGSGLVYPLTALFLRSVVGITLQQVSIYFFVLGGVAIIANPVWGSRIDRLGVRTVVLLAVAGQLLGAAVLSTATSAPVAFFAAVISGVGNSGFYAAQTPLLTHMFGKQELPSIFGTQYLLTNLMMAVGAVTGGVLASVTGATGYRIAIAGNSVSFLIYGLGVALLQRATPTTKPSPTAVSSRPAWAVWKPYRDRSFIPLIALQACFVLFGFSQFQTVLPVLVRSGLGLSVSTASVLVALNCLTVICVQPTVTRYCRRFAPQLGLAIALVVWLVAFAFGLGTAVRSTAAAATVLLVAYAIVFAVGETFIAPTFQPLVSIRAPEGELGSYAASTSLMYSLGLAIGPAVGLSLLHSGGVAAYWIGEIAFGFVGLGLVTLLRKPQPAVQSSFTPQPAAE
jgi:MFS family permease